MSDVEVKFTDSLIIIDEAGRRFKVNFISMSSYPLFGGAGKQSMGTRIEAECAGYEIVVPSEDCDLGL